MKGSCNSPQVHGCLGHISLCADLCTWNIALTVQVPCTSRSLLKLDGPREMLSFCSLISECKSVSGGGCILLTRIKGHITLMYCSSGSAQGPLCDRHAIAIISVDIGLLIVWFPLRFFHPAAALIHLPMAAIKPPSSLTWPALVLPLRTVWQCSTALLQIRLQSVIVIMAMWLPSPAVSTHTGTHTHAQLVNWTIIIITNGIIYSFLFHSQTSPSDR